MFEVGSKFDADSHPDTARTVTVPVHSRELPRWLLKKIIKDAGLSEDEFRELL